MSQNGVQNKKVIMHWTWLLTKLDTPLFGFYGKTHKTHYVLNLHCFIKNTVGKRAPSESATAAGDFIVCHTQFIGHSTL